ncbi:hypothetical protein PVAP13_9KG651101 [Panicum virgatum]|uniref:Uncharacterized protein n=1 Tax=Panicum virgatum TaxID=38727 RepID=A0A8T0P6F9_PANVG|nr:hypothetical protein PVAP13_9KG651101 [Panicum virgatum]
MSKRPRNDPSKEEDAAEGEPETRRRVCLVPWSHSPAARRRCLYLVLDDWKRGYSVHRLGVADFVESDARLVLDARSSASRRCTSTRRPSRPTGPRSWRCIPNGSAPASPCSTLSESASPTAAALHPPASPAAPPPAPADLRGDTAVNPPSTAGGRFLRGRRIGLRQRTRAAIGELEQSGSPATAGRDISARQGYWTPGGSWCCDLRT